METEADIVDGFEAGSFRAAGGFALPYRLYRPSCKPGLSYPLILHLHGAGSWEDDNTAQLTQARRFVRPDYPAFILAPKTIRPMKWVDLDWSATGHVQPVVPTPSLQAAHELLMMLLRHEPAADSARVYATGQSMGGYGVWDMITRYRETFTAAVPVCGGGDVAAMARLSDLPIWAFHGAKDTAVPVQNSRALVAALRRAGSTVVRYTEYPELGHAAWEPAYDNPALFEWLFAQGKETGGEK